MKTTLEGRILFEPENITKKHEAQSSWKKVAFVEFDGDVCEYYGWFLNRRYGIILNKILRNPHISFINDSLFDMSKNGAVPLQEVLNGWDELKRKYDGSAISIKLFVDPRSNGKHWWLNVPEEDRAQLHQIRAEVGLGRPYFGLHMSLGYVNERNIEHSEYIVKLLSKGFIP